jgi:propanediol utilization protein
VSEVSREEFEELKEELAELKEQVQLLRNMTRVDSEGRVLVVAHEVRARKLSVVGAHRKPCVTMMSNDDGGRIGMRNRIGQTVWVAGAGSDGGVLALTNTRGKVGLKASGGPEGGSISLHTRTEKDFWTAP